MPHGRCCARLRQTPSRRLRNPRATACSGVVHRIVLTTAGHRSKRIDPIGSDRAITFPIVRRPHHPAAQLNDLIGRAHARPIRAYSDWGLNKLTAPQRRDLLEILEERHERRSTLVTSQLPVEHWHKMIGEPTHADAILDRLVHSAYRVKLKGESMRKLNAKGGSKPKLKS